MPEMMLPEDPALDITMDLCSPKKARPRMVLPEEEMKIPSLLVAPAGAVICTRMLALLALGSVLAEEPGWV